MTRRMGKQGRTLWRIDNLGFLARLESRSVLVTCGEEESGSGRLPRFFYGVGVSASKRAGECMRERDAQICLRIASF